MRLSIERATALILTFASAWLWSGDAAERAWGAPLVSEAELAEAGLTRFWEAHLPFAAGESIAAAYRVDEALYVTTTHGRLFSITADVGLLRWGLNLTEPDYTVYEPTHARTADDAGPVVVATTTETFVIDRHKGAVLTKFTPKFPAGSPAVAQGTAAYMGSSDGRLYAVLFDPTGRRPAVELWQVMAGGPVTAKPVLFGRETLVFASHRGAVYACLASDKTLLWSYRTGDAVLAGPAFDGSGVYVASTDRSLYKLALGTGGVLWRVRFPRPLVESPVVLGGRVYQYGRDNGLSALDADSGKAKWRLAEGRRFVSQASGGDLVFAADKRLLVVDRETGAHRASVETSGVFDAVTNMQDDAAYLLGQPNRVLCLRLDKTPYLRRQQVTAARRQLNVRPSDPAEPLPAAEPAGERDEPDPLARDPLRSRGDIPPK